MKRLFLLALVIVLPSIALADEQPKFYMLKTFYGGLNSHSSEYALEESDAAQADNVRFNKRYAALAKRPINIAYGASGVVGAHPVDSLHRYYKSDGTTKLIAQGSTKVYVGDDDAGTFQTIGTGYSDGKRFTWVTYKDVAVGSNGYEQPIKYDGLTDVTANTDGNRTAENVVAELGAPFAELNTGTDLDASKWYQYMVAFDDGSTYYYSEARSNAIQTGAAVYNITLTDIPLGPTGTTTRSIFRCEGQADRAATLALDNDSFKLVDTIGDNTTTTYNDSVDDGSLTTVYSTWITNNSANAVTPPLMRYIIVHDEKLFGATNSTYLSDVYWSDTYNPDFFYATDFIQVRPDDGDEVTFLREQLGILTIGKKTTIQKFYTEDTSDTDWTLSDPFSFVGCPAPYSVANTPKGIFYLSWDGIYTFTGQKSNKVSDAVTPEIYDILQSNIGKTAGFYYKNEYHLAYTSMASGVTYNNRVLVYDFDRDAYARDHKDINSWAAFDSGVDFGVLYHGSSTTDGMVYADTGAPDVLVKKLKSEFDAGTFDDSRSFGTELLPEIELSWDLTIDDAVGTINTHAYGASVIIDRPDTDGTWTSPVYRIDAFALDQAQWNERLGVYGDVTLQLKSCDDAACDGESFEAAVTDPSGSDVSSITANDYIQFRFNLSTTDIEYTPYLYSTDGYLLRLFYTKSGSTKESSVLSVWQSSWLDMKQPGFMKFLRRVRVFYKGDTGTINVQYENNQGDVDRNFDIDLTVDGDDNPDDYYTARGENFKVYTHYPAENADDDPAPIGTHWRFTLSEDGNDEWVVYGIEVEYYYEEVYQ